MSQSLRVAMGNCLHNPKKNSNHSQLCRLLIDIGTRVLRDFFDSIHSPHSLQATLKDPYKKEVFERLHSEGDLSSVRWSILCGTSTDDVSSQNFDIVLLCFLLRYFSHLKPPQTGWHKTPLSSDLSKEADFTRICLFRNSMSDYALCITDEDFGRYWKDLKAVFIRLGGQSYANEIGKMEKKHFDPRVDKNFIEKVISWKSDEDNLVMGMREIESERTYTEEIKDNDQNFTIADESQLLSDPEKYRQNLKSSIQSKTENLPNYNAHILEEMKMEDVFTCLKITDTKSTEIREEAPCTVVIKKCAEIFMNDNGKNPTRLALVAGSGVGKSLFALKLLRMFARDELFEGVSNPPNLAFPLFLTFRELNLVDIDINLKELLNLSSTLNQNSKIGSAMLDYFLQHPEEVFVLMDGIDEFMYFDKLGNDYDKTFPNDANVKMPVGVLCDKLLRGKLLSDSVIMVTSRPDEAWDVMKRVHFDRYLEIVSTSTSKNISGPFRYRLW